MSVPAPQPGLVISYAYLWAREHNRGTEEGAKDRPCAIVAARQVIEGREVVTVVPITHSPPTDPADAIEIPPALKAHLGLDDLPSWIVVNETNDISGPAPIFGPVPASNPRASITVCCRRGSSRTSGTGFCRRTCTAR